MRILLNSILLLANSLSEPYNLSIKDTNFVQQFCPSIIENKAFNKLKIYKYYIYNTSYKDDKKHIESGTKNVEVIKTMVFEKKDEIYIALMKTSIKNMYNKFIQKIKEIKINGKIVFLPNFKIINDIIKERQKCKRKR